MIKKIMFLALIMVGISASAQQFKVDKVNLNFQGIKVMQTQTVEDGEVVRTSSYVYFQNLKYQYVSDLKFIWFYSQENVDNLADDLEKMLTNVPEGAEARLGNFVTYDFAPKVIYINAEGGYNRISRKKAKELLIALRNLKV